MSRESFVIILGIFIVMMPSLGIPNEWKTYGLIGAGILFILVGYQLRYARYLRSIDRGNGERGGESFVESTGQRANTTPEA